MTLNGVAERLMAGRWLAGERIGDAIGVSRRFNSHGISAMINYLGESLAERSAVDCAVKTYARLIREIKRSGIRASISIKPTQLGASIGKGVALRNYASIVGLARSNGIFTWLDMEEHRYVDTTIRLYRSQLKRGAVGICIQAYLRRSASDLESIVRSGGVVRLVKGAYGEPSRLAYATRDETTANYSRLMAYLFRHSPRFMIATHDPAVIAEAQELNRSYRRDVTYAMLNGIRNRELLRLAETGSKAAAYVPFGEQWISYALRRLREEGNLPLLLRSLFESQRLRGRGTAH